MWLASGGLRPQTPCPGALPLDPSEGSALRLPEARARRARRARQLAPHALNSNSAHAAKWESLSGFSKAILFVCLQIP